MALTIDDGYTSWTETIDPILEKFNLSITGFINNLEAVDRDLTWEDVKRLSETGRWEFGWHSTNHPDLTTLSNKKEEEEISVADELFTSQSLPNPKTFCYPYGAYDFTTIATSKKYFSFARTVDEGTNSAYWVQEHPMEIKVTRIYQGRDTDFYKDIVSENLNKGTFIVFYLHAVGEPVEGSVEITTEDFETLMEWLSRQDVKIVSFNQGLNEMKERDYQMKLNIIFDNPLQQRYTSAIPIPSRYWEVTFISARVLGKFNPLVGDLILKYNTFLTILVMLSLLLCIYVSKSLIKRRNRSQ